MMKVAIVDDEEIVTDQIQSLVDSDLRQKNRFSDKGLSFSKRTGMGFAGWLLLRYLSD